MERYKLRQFALMTKDLEAAIDNVSDVFRLHVSDRHDFLKTWGLKNALLPVGDSFLEIVQPLGKEGSGARFIEKKGEGGYMLCFEVDNVIRQRKRLEARGVRSVAILDSENPFSTSAFEPSKEDYAIRVEMAKHHHYAHYHPKDFGGVFVEMDEVVGSPDWLAPDSKWFPGGHDWLSKKSDFSRGIAGGGLGFKDPVAAHAQWMSLFDIPSAGGLTLAFEHARIDFSQSDVDGQIQRLDIAVDSPEAAIERAQKRGLAVDNGVIQISGLGFRPVRRPGL